jgi:hypothetical protein
MVVLLFRVFPVERRGGSGGSLRLTLTASPERGIVNKRTAAVHY